MKARGTARSMSLALVLALAVASFLPAVGMAAEAPVNLGTTRSFAILAGQGITNTGSTVIDGDAGNNVGIHPGALSNITGFAPPPAANNVVMTGGQLYASDQNAAVALQAKNDLGAAILDADSRAITATKAADLSNTTLIPGVYDFSPGTVLISANQTLTLDAQNNPDAVFIIRATSDLTVESGAAVKLINGARYCRVFWVVPTSATIGTNAHFVGHILAHISITVNTGATVQGQLLTESGAVTLDTNHLTNGLCANIRTLEITKTARDVNGGSLNAGDAIEWTITVKNTSTGDPVTNVIIRDAVPANTAYVAGSITGPGAIASGVPNLQWNVGTIAPSGQVVLTFRTTVNAGLPRGTAIANQASSISDQTNLQLSSSTAGTAAAATLIRTGVDDRLWLSLAVVLLLTAVGLWVVDRRRRLHA